MRFGLGGALGVTLAIALSLATATGVGAAATAAQAPPPVDATVQVGGPDPVEPIPASFVGLSMEYQSAAALAGPAGNPDTVLEQLIRNLDPGQVPVLRIGGDSTDHTWYPAPGLVPSPGLTFALTPAWMQSVAAFADALDARLILGVNLEANQPELAAVEAQALLADIGRPRIEALEIGNEPSVYPLLPWYTTAAGQPVSGRARGFDFGDYLRQFERVVAALPGLPLAAPALGSTRWMRRLPSLLRAVPSVGVVTFHRYPLNRCFTSPSSPTYPTIAHLLSRAATIGLAHSVARFAADAAAAGRQFRVDELNSVACEGSPGVSDTFASALWVLDTLFAFAREGVSGVNIHTLPPAAYRLFTIDSTAGQWSASVMPEYYGLLMFVRAAPPAARLLHVMTAGDPSMASWATQTPGGATNVVLINMSDSRAARATVRAAAPAAAATRELLRAPSLEATSGVTLGGTSIPPGTTTGLPAAPPQTTQVRARRGLYTVAVPAGSAVLLTIR